MRWKEKSEFPCDVFCLLSKYKLTWFKTFKGKGFSLTDQYTMGVSDGKGSCVLMFFPRETKILKH